ncbi:SCP2 sterol-binding domain-containing protein, partial [Salmonella enterica subsp. enterica serovar Kentucky]|nr:SCP2 sterol-binding domain-containing protein [Salmonella enterica subsp. enterica serovar Kentucky]
PGFAADESVGVLEYVNDDGVTVKEEVKPETGDYGRVYDALYQMLIVSQQADADVSFSADASDLLMIAARKQDPDTLFFQRRLVIE